MYLKNESIKISCVLKISTSQSIAWHNELVSTYYVKIMKLNIFRTEYDNGLINKLNNL